MGESPTLGDFEMLVLATLVRIGDRAYGAQIFRELEERTGRSVAMGAVYTTLYRLEEKGLVDSEKGEPTPIRGGRARRYYRIMGAGVEAMQRSIGDLAALLENTDLGWSSP